MGRDPLWVKERGKKKPASVSGARRNEHNRLKTVRQPSQSAQDFGRDQKAEPVYSFPASREGGSKRRNSGISRGKRVGAPRRVLKGNKIELKSYVGRRATA